MDPQNIPAKKILLYQFIILMLSALINPYLSWMVLGFTFATSVKFYVYERVISRKNLWYYVIISLVSIFFLWFLTGMVHFGKKEDLGIGGAYGLYALNLNSLFNSGDLSTYFSHLKMMSWHQYEGYMYLGLGIYFLIGFLFPL
jgi:hypothetical protein